MIFYVDIKVKWYAKVIHDIDKTKKIKVETGKDGYYKIIE